MMELLRQSVGGWVAKIFIGLLVASFAVWGVSDAFLGGQQSTVAQVGKTKVDSLDFQLAYDNQVNALSRQFGRRLTREQAQSFGVESNVISQLVSDAILEENARKMGLGLSVDKLAQQIGNDPAFRDASGRFSRTQLELTLRNIGMRESEYIARREAGAISRQIIQGASNNSKVPAAFFDALKQYQSEKRTFEYVVVSSDQVTEKPVPTDGEISAYYAENTDSYRAPEYRKLIVVKLEPIDIADETTISEEELKQDYEARKGNYTTPEERKILQLVVSDEEKANAYAERLKAGESFETIVKEENKTLKDVELGTFTKANVPDAAMAETAFGLELNKPSGVVKGLFGSLLLMVTEIKEESVQSFDDIKGTLRTELALANAAQELFDLHDKLEDERGAGSNLSEAATKVGLKPRIVEQIDRSGQTPDGTVISDLPNSAQLIQQAFEINEGVEADPLSIGQNGFVWYEVAGITDERQKPIDEVKEQVKTAWIDAETAKKVKQLAEGIKDKTGSAGSLEASARTALGLEDTAESPAKTSGQLLRTDQSDDLPSETVSAGFGAKLGEAVVTQAGEGKYAVLNIKDIDNSTGALNAGTEDQINASSQNDLLIQLIANMREETEVFVNQQAINAIFSYRQSGHGG